MASAGYSDLYVACCNGDENTVRRLLSTVSIKDLNHRERDGNTCLHAASSRGYKEIVRLLLAHGAYRRTRNQEGRTPLEIAKTTEIAKLYCRSIEASQKRFSDSPAQQPEWQFEDDHAESFARAIHWGCMKDRGIKKTLKKLLKSEAVPKDDEAMAQVIRNYFQDALDYNDPVCFLRAYTVESQFYKQLNREMATGSSRVVFNKLRKGWTGYYTGIIARNPAFDRFRYSGQTYRGMEITPEDYKQYKVHAAISNKSFQSTSKSWKIAEGFALPSRPRPGRMPVIIIFSITDRRCALSIEEISEFPNEEEVLILPGTLFIIADINENERPIEIEFRQIEWKNEF